jgi:hypothetical protein
MRNTEPTAYYIRLFDQLSQHRHLAQCAKALEFTFIGPDRNAGRVITAVLEPLQAIEQDRHDIALCNRADNAAH